MGWNHQPVCLSLGVCFQNHPMVMVVGRFWSLNLFFRWNLGEGWADDISKKMSGRTSTINDVCSETWGIPIRKLVDGEHNFSDGWEKVPSNYPPPQKKLTCPLEKGTILRGKRQFHLQTISFRVGYVSFQQVFFFNPTLFKATGASPFWCWFFLRELRYYSILPKQFSLDFYCKRYVLSMGSATRVVEFFIGFDWHSNEIQFFQILFGSLRSPLNIYHPKRKGLSSNHHFSGANC